MDIQIINAYVFGDSQMFPPNVTVRTKRSLHTITIEIKGQTFNEHIHAPQRINPSHFRQCEHPRDILISNQRLISIKFVEQMYTLKEVKPFDLNDPMTFPPNTNFSPTVAKDLRITSLV